MYPRQSKPRTVADVYDTCEFDDLLDAVLLQAEVMELRAPEQGPAHGVVIESRLDRGPRGGGARRRRLAAPF